MKIDDPTIDRIRQVRHQISKECDHDPRKLVAHYLEYQEQFADRLLREPRKKEKTARVAHTTSRTPEE